jgi:hypothetical protein
VSHLKGDDSVQDFEWITLSHRWGNGSPLTTTLDSLSKRQQSIPLNSMPPTFRDAITITKKLGFRHLWIDSLCIIQDSGEDWAYEASNMGLVYQNAVLNIAADAAEDCNRGLLHHRHWNSFEENVAISIQSRKHKFCCILNIRPALEGWSLASGTSVLSDRAWVLQESILSPRTLHYGKKQMFWECRESIAAEGSMSQVAAKSEENLSRLFIKRLLLPPLTHVDNFSQSDTIQNIWYRRWYIVLEDYSWRDITYHSDILPAISGIASTFQSKLKDQYHAGLFSGDMLQGLKWKLPETGKEKPTMYCAPSWSWASVIGTKEWDIPLNGVQHIKGHTAEILEINTIPAQSINDSLPNFGQVSSGHILIRGWFRAISSWCKKNNGTNWGLSDHRGYTDNVRCYFDVGTQRDYLSSNIPSTQFGFLQLDAWRMFSIEWIDFIQLLILEPVNPAEDKWRRIGYAVLYMDEDENSGDCNEEGGENKDIKEKQDLSNNGRYYEGWEVRNFNII